VLIILGASVAGLLIRAAWDWMFRA
jgi:hypothetical protein